VLAGLPLLLWGSDRGEPEAALRAELEALDCVVTAWDGWAQDPTLTALAELGKALDSYRSAVEAARKDT
jgi:hypothetical protein